MKKNIFWVVSLILFVLVFLGGFLYNDQNNNDQKELGATAILATKYEGFSINDLNLMIDSLISRSDTRNTDPVVSYLLEQRKKLVLENLSSEYSSFNQSTNLLSESTRMKLSSLGYANFEETVSLSGKLEISVYDEFRNPENSRYEYHIATQNGSKYKVYTENIEKIDAGADLKITGYILDGNVWGTVELQSAPDNDSSSEDFVLGSPAPYDIAVFLVTSPKKNLPFTKAEAESQIFSGQFQNFIKENSYNRRYARGDVYGWINSNATNLCTSNINFTDPDVLDYIRSEKIELSAYKHILFIANCNDNRGFSTIGPVSVNVDQINYNFSMTNIFVGPGIFLPYTNLAEPLPTILQPFKWTNFDFLMVHEMGHAFGLRHARGLDCDKKTIGLPFECFYVEYGNHFDAMGSGFGYSLHFNGKYKETLGWLKPEEVLTITKSGTYTISPLETLGGYKLAKIINPTAPLSSATYYTVEHRRAVGFDRALGAYSYLNKNTRGLFINRFEVVYNHLLDTTPSEKNWLEDTSDASLTDSSIFKDEKLGITIGPIISNTKSGLTFSVTIEPVK